MKVIFETDRKDIHADKVEISANCKVLFIHYRSGVMGTDKEIIKVPIEELMTIEEER